MNRNMRRNMQEIHGDDIIKVLNDNTYGVLAMVDSDGYPYQVAINYAYVDGKIVMHGAKTGHKIDAISANDKVTLCVVDKHDPLGEEFTTLYRSVMVFGRARIIDNEQEARDLLTALALKFNPSLESATKTIDDGISRTAVIVIDIENMRGKQSLRLFNK